MLNLLNNNPEVRSRGGFRGSTCRAKGRGFFVIHGHYSLEIAFDGTLLAMKREQVNLFTLS
jgi:hypothetical protein